MRPNAVAVLGTLNLVFGTLGILGTMFLGGILDAVMTMTLHPSQFQVYARIDRIAGFFAAFVLILAGVGLLKMRPWGRYLSIVYAGFAILSVIANTIALFMFVPLPLLDNASLSIIGAVVLSGAAIGLLYPLLLIVLLQRRSVVEAFASSRAPPTHQLDRR